MSIVFSLICEATNAPITPPAAPSIVTTATSARRPSVIPSVEPALKPNQPKNRMSTPRPTSGIECPGITRGLPSGPYLSLRGPSSSSAARAPVAPIRCTAVEPAKSCMPVGSRPVSPFCSQPPPNTQCDPIG